MINRAKNGKNARNHHKRDPRSCDHERIRSRQYSQRKLRVRHTLRESMSVRALHLKRKWKFKLTNNEHVRKYTRTITFLSSELLVPLESARPSP